MTNETSRLLEGNGRTTYLISGDESTPGGTTRSANGDSAELTDITRVSTLQLTTIVSSGYHFLSN
jgi:hypothetical protein